MNTTLHVQITGLGRTTANAETDTSAADIALWREAAVVLRERAYATDSGVVRVTIDWNPIVSRAEDDDRPIALDVTVIGEPDPRDVVTFVELFFHEVFLIMNIAVPGSFGGAIAILADGEHRASEVVLNARLFEYAWATATRNGWPSIEACPLASVVEWYDSLEIGTQQLATTNVAKALFLLLHLSCTDENESMSMLCVGQMLEALFEGELNARIAEDLGEWVKLDGALKQFLALRNAIAHGSAPVLHPMANDALDDRIDDASIEMVNSADFVASVVVAAMQERVRPR